MSNSVDPDETAHYEPSHLDLLCLQSLLISPVAVKELMRTGYLSGEVILSKCFACFLKRENRICSK